MAYQGLSGAVKGMSVVSSKLGVGALQRRVSRGLGLLDTVALSISYSTFTTRGFEHTRCGGLCATGCAGTSSLTLFRWLEIIIQFIFHLHHHLLAMAASECLLSGLANVRMINLAAKKIVCCKALDRGLWVLLM